MRYIVVIASLFLVGFIVYLRNKKKKKGLFIVIEGPDFSGKSTVAARAKKLLGRRALITREPGGAKGLAPIANEFRELALNSEYGENASGTEIFLVMWASRIAHMHELIIKAYKAGKIIISDRSDASTWAYNITAQEAPHLKEPFWLLRERVFGEIEPDIYIYFHLTPEEALKRKQKSRPDGENHFDKKGFEFQMAMRAGYAEFFQELTKKKGRICHIVVDANQTEEEVWHDFLLILEGEIHKKEE